MNSVHRKRARLYILLALALLDALLIITGKASALAVLLTLVVVSGGIVLGARLALRHSRLIWRVRDRLIVTYVFVGVVPIVLILGLAFLGTWIVAGQIATYLVSSELSRRAISLENPARFLSEAPANERGDVMKELAPLLAGRYPSFEVLVTGDQVYRYPADSVLEPPPEGWKRYTGLVSKEGKYYLMALATTGHTQAIVLAPLGPEVLSRLIPGLGSVYLGGRWAGLTPEAANSVDFETIWYNDIEATRWDQPNTLRTTRLEVGTRPSAVLAVVFGDRVDFAQTILIGFVLVSILLAIVELLSVVIGGSMTRTITNAVDNLYEGTQQIAKGDFAHRIPVKGRDQLAALGKSFNQMSSQLEFLVRITREKERLESELTIASEVQKQLFPRNAPPMRTIELIGACEPARSASGDYYDYLLLPNGNLAVAIGDVAGKGISAALLMASIQSIMRTQLAQGVPRDFSTAAMVSQLNRQLYANTSPEKYATFFFGLYDETSRSMTYTNAGHLPPLLVCGNNATPLEVTGTVVGLFPAMNYGEHTITLHYDDMLVAYTDGITEPENAYGEEFGIERLTESVLRNRACEPCEIVAKAMEAVKHWSNAPELPDDMTVLIAKGIA
jgi:sigma-B regulation protein RsbU (phosphoserine phosphatase)